jgi:hypothetical protein
LAGWIIDGSRSDQQSYAVPIGNFAREEHHPHPPRRTTRSPIPLRARPELTALSSHVFQKMVD